MLLKDVIFDIAQLAYWNGKNSMLIGRSIKLTLHYSTLENHSYLKKVLDHLDKYPIDGWENSEFRTDFILLIKKYNTKAD